MVVTTAIKDQWGDYAKAGASSVDKVLKVFFISYRGVLWGTIFIFISHQSVSVCQEFPPSVLNITFGGRKNPT
jgi:hypothetical protein